jgi:hypothetical protein
MRDEGRGMREGRGRNEGGMREMKRGKRGRRLEEDEEG